MSKNILLSRSFVFILFAIFLGSIYSVGFLSDQKDFAGIIIPYSISFCIYILFVFKLDRSDYFFGLLCLAAVCRILLLFSFPNLSDDIYRFLWDAQLVLDGQNPYLLLPDNIVTPENQALYDQLNSPSYYSPYPPVAQIIYSIAAYVSDADLQIFSLVIKLFTLTAELVTIYYMVKLLDLLDLARTRVFIYALNPLIIIELMGNLHFESFMILFVMGTVYHLIKSNYTMSSVAFVLAIASKLLPLMFTPFLLAYLGIKRSIRFLIITGILTMVVFIPIIIGIIDGTFLSSVGLYFQKFEFNASLYYLLREVGFLIYGWNTIGTLGPTLALSTLGAICFVWYKQRSKIVPSNLFLYLLFTITIYLFAATTVHPWYVALPLAFCLFTEFRFPMIWSGLIYFTYYNYSQTHYQENLWIVFVEYAIVFSMVIFELRKLKRT